jgi:hypothetical protein
MVTRTTECYVPAHCAGCLRAFLTPLGVGAEVRCGNCGGPARVVPGELYRTEDTSLFDEVEAAFRAVALPAAETLRIVSELGNVRERKRAPYALLLRLLRPLPGLQFLEPTHPTEQARLVRGMGMLLAIAAAHLQYGISRYSE